MHWLIIWRVMYLIEFHRLTTLLMKKKYLERYKQAYPFLSIDEIKMKDYTSPEYKEINQKLHQKDKEINSLNSVIYDLKARLEAIEEEKVIKSDVDLDNFQDIVNEAVKRLKENPNEKERIILDTWDEYEPASE